MSDSILPYVSKPARYLGGEFNAFKKDRQAMEVHFALLFPDLYEIGMSHFGLQILYHLLNNEEKYLAERCFAPDKDAEKLHRQKQLPLLSLESGQPLSSFDVMGITLPYELCYSNILTLLDLSGIPRYSKERDDSHPLILGGGSCSFNPEPVAPFFDAILLGDGEEAILEIAAIVQQEKKAGSGKHALLRRLAAVQGVYIPSFFTPEYDDNGRLTAITNSHGTSAQVDRRIVSDLNATAHLQAPIVPNAKIVHDRLGVEIARGCTRGCRFCQAGMTYRPVRERTVEQIMDLAENGIEHSGFEELALLSLSTGDHSCINDLLPRLMDRFAEDHVSVSMPSMRVGTLSQPVMDQIQRVRKTGFTVAPEAGSERLRRVINKGITEDDLLETCKNAFTLGWNGIKLYFMIGLPTETMKDIDAIIELTQKIKRHTAANAGKRAQITTSVGTFVPKPHTPFQWHEQLSLEESRRRIIHLKKNMPKKGAKLKWHDPEMSFLEGVFSRGDRQLAPLIECAFSLGARLDGWSDHFDFTLWQQAAEQCGIDLSTYLRARDDNEILPWQHLSSGVDIQFLQQENANAGSETYTPDCRYHGCQQCGLCDFTTIMPIVHNSRYHQLEHNTTAYSSTGSSNDFATSRPQRSTSSSQGAHREQHFKYRVNYSRLGKIGYLGHLEILQLVFRSLKRAGIHTAYSKGFNPSPKISFGEALPVGMESDAEFFIMDLPAPLADPTDAADRLNNSLPEGLHVQSIELHSGKMAQSIINTYAITLPRGLSADEWHACTTYLNAEQYPVTRIRKGKVGTVDLRPLLLDIRKIDNRTLEIDMRSTVGIPGVKIAEALAPILLWQEEELLQCRLRKTGWQAAAAI
ncbi:MAG: TIGR03960 family B12-binding radical SAM protein [Desulfopila sp.]